jgi:hypothetical protein
MRSYFLSNLDDFGAGPVTGDPVKGDPVKGDPVEGDLVKGDLNRPSPRNGRDLGKVPSLPGADGKRQ